MYNENNTAQRTTSNDSSSSFGEGAMNLLLSLNLSNHRARRSKKSRGNHDKKNNVIGTSLLTTLSGKTKTTVRSVSQRVYQHAMDPDDNDEIASLYSTTSSSSSSSRSSTATTKRSSVVGDTARRTSTQLWMKAVTTVHSSLHHRTYSDGSTITAVPMDTKNQRRHVSFCHSAKVRNTIALQDLSDEECQASWYSMKEYNAITLSCTIQIEKIERGEKLEPNKYCERGLETHCGARALVKSKNRSLAIQAVLDEQSRQLEAGMLVLDPEIIALVYRNASSSSQLWANVMGMHDQHFVEDWMDDELYIDATSGDHVGRRLSITTKVPPLDVTSLALQQKEASARAA